MSTKLTGTCKWFNTKKGFGFIKPDGEGEDLFVHQSVIKSQGFRSLGEGEVVEYNVETENGKSKAIDVTGPNGADCVGEQRNQHQGGNFGGNSRGGSYGGGRGGSTTKEEGKDDVKGLMPMQQAWFHRNEGIVCMCVRFLCVLLC